MYGDRVYEAVLASGEVTTGLSIHLVDAEYDTGPLISQCAFPVEPGDTVATLAVWSVIRERAFAVETFRQIAAGILSLIMGTVYLINLLSP